MLTCLRHLAPNTTSANLLLYTAYVYLNPFPAKIINQRRDVKMAEIRAEGRESPYVFPMGDGYQRDIKNAWAEIRTRAGIADVRVHDLRHSYASQLASAGLGLPVIGRLLGHTQAATTARYAHLSDDPLREATERVGVMFKAEVGGKRGDVVALPTKAAS